MLLDGGVTYAALILFGTHSALGKFLGQAEVVFEYRSSEAAGPAQQRKEYRKASSRSTTTCGIQSTCVTICSITRDGLFVLDISTFAERSVREAILNAVSHRDYQLGGNVFVRQYSRRLVIESPGGFPLGITTENVLDRQSTRNRRIADVFTKCGLVERSGQGMNLMFEQSIREGKARPDFTGTDSYHVRLTLHGEVGDPRFVQFLDKVGQETLSGFDTHDFLILDLVHREIQVPVTLQPRLKRLVDLGVVEIVGRGKGTRYLLSRRFYSMIGKSGAYTRRKGLDRETNKELLMKHIRENSADGAMLGDLLEVLPALNRRSVQGLLNSLRSEGRIQVQGKTRAARWFPASERR